MHLRAIYVTFTLLAWATAAAALELRSVVDISDQRMRVFVDDRPIHDWAVSTARQGKITPRGRFGIISMHKWHASSIYDDAPMPHAVFFSGDYAIHGTTQIHNLGRPVSAGCIRLHPRNAYLLYNLIRQYGRDNFTVEITD